MLITASRARAGYLPALGGSLDDTTVIEPLILTAGQLLARRAGYPASAPGAPASMEVRLYTLDLESRDGRSLDLEVAPVCSVVSASVDADADFEGNEDAVTVADIALRGGHVARLASDTAVQWGQDTGSCRVTFYAGYGGSTTVNGAHLLSATTITVASTAQLAKNATGGGRVVVGSEVILFTGHTSTTLTGCTRGAEGTTAASISNGATLSQPIPEDLQDVCGRLVRHLYDLRETQGAANATNERGSVTWKPSTSLLPADIEASFASYILSRAMV